MTIEEKIEAALFARVVTLDLGDDPVPVAWPNLTFPEPGQDTPTTYLEVRHFRNANSRLFMNGSDPHRRQGILQITVITPLNFGTTLATGLAGQIAEHFPADIALFEDGVKVRIQAAPDVLAPDKTDVSWDVPVSVRYEALI